MKNFPCVKPQWTSEYPTEAGKYWFYGSAFSLDGPSRLCMVCCRRGENCRRILIAEGNFMYEAHSCGVFMPADVPELPTDKEMA